MKKSIELHILPLQHSVNADIALKIGTLKNDVDSKFNHVYE